ncbi:putative uncharacterized protein DDB_G0282133 [Leptopilina heterotoma]|uniref:putative uncharacterized protein DDB_G0282133 n=1 Tax=Leptopilina heterotoma TaxID=63436 RepID=UPI001CA7E3A7|nr:putative uncharacterized protein DDB_G0282133 [Leptopilina heterotoma]
MMTSLVLLVPIVVSVTVAASQILDDRLISRSKDTFTVSPEMEFDSIKMDSKRSSRRHPTKINEDAKETKTSQFLLPDGISENRLSSTTPSTFKDIGLSTFKNVDRRPLTTIKTVHHNSDNNKSATDFSNIEKDRDKSPNDDRNKLERKTLQISENDVNILQMQTNNLGNEIGRSSPTNFPGGQNSTRGGQRNVKGATRNVKSAPRNVKSAQRNVKNGQGGTKSTESGVKSGVNVKTTNNVSAEGAKAETNNVQTAQDHLRTAQNNVRTVQGNVKTVQSNVKSVQSNVKTSQNNVKTGQTNVKNVENNIGSAENVKGTSNNVKSGQTNIKNAENNARSAENVKGTSNNVKTGQTNVKNAENNIRSAEHGTATSNNVKTGQMNVKNSENSGRSAEHGKASSNNVKTEQTNVKNSENNGRIAEHGKASSNNVKTGRTNVKTAEHSFRNAESIKPNVKTARNNIKNSGAESVKSPNVKIKIGQNNVKSGENTKTTSNNIKSIERNTNADNSQKTDATSSDNDVNKSRTKTINPSQTTTNVKSTLKPSSILENDPPGTDHQHRYKLGKRNRKNKGFFFHYPYVPQIRHHYPHYDSNFEDCNYSVSEERTPGGKKKYQDSNIYYIKLPPTPYMFVPGLGYVSQPPRYSPPPQQQPQLPPLNPPMANARPFRPPRPPTIYQPHVNPFIKVPIDFISNGKPTSVYQWQDEKLPSRNDNQITNLDKGPYVFNGRPSSIYLLRPDGSQTIPQPIRLNDYQNNGYYSSATFD